MLPAEERAGERGEPDVEMERIETPAVMSGVLLTAHGGPECLVWRDDIAVPRVDHGDVLIAVSAAGVNNTDINTRIGWYDKGSGTASGDTAAGELDGWSGSPLSLPRIQGADVCGRIVAVGPGVDAARIGERVIVEPCITEVHGEPLDSTWYFGSECDGGFAQFASVASRHAHAVDCDLSDVELASFPCSASTAENLLTRSAVSADDHVLVTGASGGVGTAAVQLAVARGARVTAVAGLSKAVEVRRLGAGAVVDRDADLIAELGRSSIDVVIDVVGGPDWPSLLEVLRPEGRYAVSGAIAGAMVELDLRTLYLKDLSFFGCTVLDAGVFGRLVERIEDGHITPAVAATYPLREIGAAQEAFLDKLHTGKIVLTIDTPQETT